MRRIKKLILILFIFTFSMQSFVFADSSTKQDELSISAKSAILVETNTGNIIYKKLPNEKIYPASTTKMMTAILTIENAKLTDIVTVSESSISSVKQGYVLSGLQVGEEVSVESLLYELMLPSANDVAYTLAEYVGKTTDNFVNMMNSKATEIGCKNTHFSNPNGTYDENHYSTAYDLYLIANYCIKNETFKGIVSKTEYTLPTTNKYSKYDRKISNLNDLLNPSKSTYNTNAIGIKTGHTTEAGYCLVAAASKDGMNFIAVVVGSDGDTKRFQDANKLFDYGFKNYQMSTVIKKGEVVTTILINNATTKTKKLDLLANQDIVALNKKTTNIAELSPRINLNPNTKAPIKAGDVIGTITYEIDGNDYTANLTARNDVNKTNKYIWYLIILAFIFLFLYKKVKFKNKKNRKRKSKT